MCAEAHVPLAVFQFAHAEGLVNMHFGHLRFLQKVLHEHVLLDIGTWTSLHTHRICVHLVSLWSLSLISPESKNKSLLNEKCIYCCHELVRVSLGWNQNN